MPGLGSFNFMVRVYRDRTKFRNDNLDIQNSIVNFIADFCVYPITSRHMYDWNDWLPNYWANWKELATVAALPFLKLLNFKVLSNGRICPASGTFKSSNMALLKCKNTDRYNSNFMDFRKTFLFSWEIL